MTRRATRRQLAAAPGERANEGATHLVVCGEGAEGCQARREADEADEADDLVNVELRRSEMAQRRAKFRERQEMDRAAKEADALVDAELRARETAEQQEAEREELRRAQTLTSAKLRGEGIREAAKMGRQARQASTAGAAARMQAAGPAEAPGEDPEMAALMESVLAVRTSSEPFLDKYQMEASTSECTGASGVVTFGSTVYGERPVALKFFARRADYDSELDGCKRAMGPHTIAVVDFVAPFAGRGTRGRIARCARRAASCASAPCSGGVVAPTRTRTRPDLGGDAPARWFGGGPLSALQPASVY